MTRFTRLMNAVREQFGAECSVCSRTDVPLEFAHIEPTPIARIPRGRGGNNRLHDIKRNAHAYVLMCRACHLKYDKFVRASLRLRTRVHGRWYLGRELRRSRS